MTSSESSEQPSVPAEGCSSCGRQVPTPYKTLDGLPQCGACYRRQKRQERGLQPPGPKPDPSKPRSRYGAARANEGTRGGVTGRPRKDWSTVTECENGHAFNDENPPYVYPPGTALAGQKVCRICRRNSQLRYQGREDKVSDAPVGTWNRDKTHCPAGHDYAVHGLFRSQDRSRQCRVCIRHRRIRDTYGLAPEDFDALWTEQGGACGICRRPFGDLEVWEDLRNAKVDHDHTDGGVRGLLCDGCNNGLGRYEDDPARLRAAADYIERYR